MPIRRVLWKTRSRNHPQVPSLFLLSIWKKKERKEGWREAREGRREREKERIEPKTFS